MFHLNTGVHFDEVNAVLLGVHEELHGAHVVVAHGPANAQGVVVEALAQALGQVEGGRHFHHFLEAALNRAVALVEVREVAVLVAHELYLNVFGSLHEFLQEHRIVAKGIESLIAGLEKALAQLFIVADDAHAAPAAPAGRLQHHGVADAVGLSQSRIGVN